MVDLQSMRAGVKRHRARLGMHADRGIAFQHDLAVHGGPGCVFLFDENDVADRLVALDDVTGGALRWSETAGLKQIVRTTDLNENAALTWVPGDYDAPAGKEAA